MFGRMFKGYLCEGDPAPAGTGAPGAGATPPAAPPQAPPAPPIPPVAPSGTPPVAAAPQASADPKKDKARPFHFDGKEFKERLAQHENSILKKHGLESQADLQRKLDELKQLKQAQLTEHERLTQQTTELNQRVEQLAPYQQHFETLVTAQFSALPETHQQWVDARANGDPLQRQQWMQALHDLQALQPPQEANPPAPSGPAPPVSAGNAGKPPPAPQATRTPFQEWEQMAADSPMMATIFYQKNARKIEETRPA